MACQGLIDQPRGRPNSADSMQNERVGPAFDY
jgi:hypothetical protein